jgi:hypothetical protein
LVAVCSVSGWGSLARPALSQERNNLELDGTDAVAAVGFSTDNGLRLQFDLVLLIPAVLRVIAQTAVSQNREAAWLVELRT